MKVYVRQEESRIHNDDIKWYLANESLWITKYDNYADIEKSMGNSYGSFNWLYEVNDTLLFEKESGKFSLAVISLSRKVNIMDHAAEKIVHKITGNQYIREKEHCRLEFDNRAYYECDKDY